MPFLQLFKINRIQFDVAYASVSQKKSLILSYIRDSILYCSAIKSCMS